MERSFFSLLALFLNTNPLFVQLRRLFNLCFRDPMQEVTPTPQPILVKTSLEEVEEAIIKGQRKWLEAFEKKLKRASILHEKPVVPFDPTNLEHQAALLMLMYQTRQHSRIRFAYDPATFDSAYAAALFAMAEHGIEKQAREMAKEDLLYQADLIRGRSKPAKKLSQKPTKKKVKAKKKKVATGLHNTHFLVFDSATGTDRTVNQKVS